MADERDSLGPHVAAIAKSKRVQSLALKAVPLLLTAAIYPAFTWLTTRYDTESAKLLTARTGVVERIVGLPSPEQSITNEKTLRDRVLVLERESSLRHQEELRHDHELYSRVVSVAAATTERNAALRSAAARAAVSAYDRACNCWGEVGNVDRPYRCDGEPAKAAAQALETRPPGH